MLAAFLSTILFSISGVSGARTAKLIGGTEANFWRLTLAGCFLGVWSYGFGIGLGGDSLPLFLLSGVVGIGLGDSAYFQGLPRLGSRLSLLLLECLAPPFGAAIEWLWLGTTLTTREIFCGLVILAGVGIALTPGRHVKNTPGELFSGTVFCTVAAFATALGAVLSRKAYAVATAAGNAPDGGNAAFQRVLGGLVVAGVVLLLAKQRELKVQTRAPLSLVNEAARRKWRGAWAWVLVNSLAGQTLGVSCMQWALFTTPTGIVLSIIAVTPIVVIPFSWIIEGERPTVHSIAGGIVAVAGVIALTLWR